MTGMLSALILFVLDEQKLSNSYDLARKLKARVLFIKWMQNPVTFKKNKKIF